MYKFKFIMKLKYFRNEILAIINSFNFFHNMLISLRNCNRIASYTAINAFGISFVKQFEIIRINKKPHLHLTSILRYCRTAISILCDHATYYHVTLTSIMRLNSLNKIRSFIIKLVIIT